MTSVATWKSSSAAVAIGPEGFRAALPGGTSQPQNGLGVWADQGFGSPAEWEYRQPMVGVNSTKNQLPGESGVVRFAILPVSGRVASSRSE